MRTSFGTLNWSGLNSSKIVYDADWLGSRSNALFLSNKVYPC